MRVARGIVGAGWIACASAACGAAPPEDKPVSVVEVDAPPAAPTASATSAVRSADDRGPRAGETFSFSTDFEAASARAQRERRPMLIAFHAQWSGACKEIEKNVYADPRFVDAAAQYVGVMVDMTDDENPEAQRLRGRFGVLGLPTTILIDEGGRETARVVEYQPIERWLERLRSIRPAR